MRKKRLLVFAVPIMAILLWSAVGTNIKDFFMPGSQPGQSGNLEHPDKCDNCHGGYDLAVEPAFNWRGSMMAQAQRDPLYLACLAIANQDAPESGDLCIRCHTPDGWLNGRSEPTDGSALNSNDREGVQCDFCHKLVKPSAVGVNPYPNDPDYTASTFAIDQDYLGQLTVIPPQSGNGMYIVHSSNAKRGPFLDAAARHQMEYSPFHSESDICATCHDVSNPVYTKNADGTYSPNPLGSEAPEFETYQMLPIERTYSEWKMSAYNTPEGIPSEVFGGNKANVSTCQDCHMKDVSGYGCNKKGVPFRDDLPLHDMTGGNTFIPFLVNQLFPEETNATALQAGVDRARAMLQSAATVELKVTELADGFNAEVKVINETGHKLPSGYPEGRRMWLNLQAFDLNGNLVYESGAYDQETAILTKDGTKIYEVKLGMSETIAAAASADGKKVYQPGESFHFVLNDIVVKDNRIPPRGFTNENFEMIQSPVVNYSYSDGQYWDITNYSLPSETFHVKVQLLYQTVSKEYVEFLRDENYTNDAGDVMYYLWETNGKSKPEVMAEQNFYNGKPPVKNINVGSATLTRYTVKGGRAYVVASIYIVDADNNPVSGAQVTGQYSGPSSKIVSGFTNAQGYLELESSRVKNANGTWCLEITDVAKPEYEYTNIVQICEANFKSVVIEPEEREGIKEQFYVYPNPATSYVNIKFGVLEEAIVGIEIYNMAGAKVGDMGQKQYTEGVHEINWSMNDLPSGSYIIRKTINGKLETTIVNKR